MKNGETDGQSPFSTTTTTTIRLPRLPEATTPFIPHSPYRAKPSLPFRQLPWYVRPFPLPYVSYTYPSSLFDSVNVRRSSDRKKYKTPEKTSNIHTTSQLYERNDRRTAGYVQ